VLLPDLTRRGSTPVIAVRACAHTGCAILLFCFLTPGIVAAVAREGVAVAVLADPLATEIESLGVMDDVDAIWRV
jgi:hypothetical protein